MRGLKAKDEYGSITLFVLIAMLFFLGVTISLFTTTMNSSTAQQKDIKKIQSEYNNAQDLNIIYEQQRDKFRSTAEL